MVETVAGSRLGDVEQIMIELIAESEDRLRELEECCKDARHEYVCVAVQQSLSSDRPPVRPPGQSIFPGQQTKQWEKDQQRELESALKVYVNRLKELKLAQEAHKHLCGKREEWQREKPAALKTALDALCPY